MQSVLALETSCDDSAVAIVQFNEGKYNLIAHRIASQASHHAQWGGVVPEMASRRHLEDLPKLIDEVFDEITFDFQQIDAVASTITPGLAGSLLMGSITGRTLAVLHNKPFLGIHHLEGHLSSVLLTDDPPKFPYIVLLVSGGHTELIKVSKTNSFERLGRSHDDAAGEAFDKVARLLGLPYPGGPQIEKLAKNGDPLRFNFPRGRVSNPQGGFYPYDFSFSGLKTAVLRETQKFLEKNQVIPKNDIAASFENAVTEVLVQRSIKCVEDEGLNKIVLVGGVAANTRLREKMFLEGNKKSIQVYLAPKEFCTDNAAMIGAAAISRLISGQSISSLEIGVSPRWQLEQSHLLYAPNPPF